MIVKCLLHAGTRLENNTYTLHRVYVEDTTYFNVISI